ncbi:hypothetical protein ACFFX0_23055 [Citricoccus parietis]|uniref:Uncharacterized protein n=1 Tax=Citricoccus parietis TaxID=592307 RepID=A0ABV5G4Q9_9MICC
MACMLTALQPVAPSRATAARPATAALRVVALEAANFTVGSPRCERQALCITGSADTGEHTARC